VLPNAITLLRIPVLAIVTGLLYSGQATLRYVAAGLILLLIFMDTLDGVVARATKQTSLLGSVLDIAADRTVELVLWVIVADLDLVPIVVPLAVIARGVFVDALRSMAPAHGLAPFDLVQSQIGRFLVASPWLRTPYGIAKAAAFFLLALRHAGAASEPAVGAGSGLAIGAQVAVWTAMALCLLRGLPVCIEGPPHITALSPRNKKTAGPAKPAAVRDED